MKQITELLEKGEVVELGDLIPEGTITLKELLATNGLTDIGVHSVMVNGKKADQDTLITPQSEIVIIPAIAGG